jgi:hypothetical protein
MTIQQLIPKDKFDIETVDRLSDYSFDEVRQIAPDLLTWIQDMSWPVAKPISKYLQSISEHLTEDIIKILKGTDDTWKYWTLHVFGLWTTKPLDKKIIEEIKRIANSPTRRERDEEVDEIARRIIID